MTNTPANFDNHEPPPRTFAEYAAEVPAVRACPHCGCKLRVNNTEPQPDGTILRRVYCWRCRMNVGTTIEQWRPP